MQPKLFAPAFRNLSVLIIAASMFKSCSFNGMEPTEAVISSIKMISNCLHC